MKKYDVIIIGAGLSGCVLGYLLRKQNKKVLIIEKQNLTKKNKLCGGVLTEKAYELLKKIYRDNINSLKFNIFDKVTIINKNKNTIINDIKLYTISRKELDEFVLQEYKKMNGEILENSVFSNLNINKKNLKVGNITYHYEYLIAADGVLSKVRTELTNQTQNMNFALEGFQNNPKNNDLQIYFFDKSKSYAWLIPNKKNVLIGLVDVSSKTDIMPIFKKHLQKSNININNVKGAFLPVGNDILLEFGNYIRFIGDAAGLISPITGEGIYYSLISALILSENMGKYKSNMKLITKKINYENFYKKFVYSTKVRNYLFTRSNNLLFKKIINKFANKIL